MKCGQEVRSAHNDVLKVHKGQAAVAVYVRLVQHARHDVIPLLWVKLAFGEQPRRLQQVFPTDVHVVVQIIDTESVPVNNKMT